MAACSPTGRSTRSSLAAAKRIWPACSEASLETPTPTRREPPLDHRERSLARSDAAAIFHLLEGNRLARRPAVRAPTRALRLGSGAAAGLALHLRGRVPAGARRIDNSAL